jgi:hypothetical protein
VSRARVVLLHANYSRDEGRSLGVGLQDQASNHPELRRSKAVVVSVGEKSQQRLRQVRFGKTNKSEPSMTCRELYQWRQNRDGRLTRERAQREPAYWLGGARHKGGVSPNLALLWNVRTCRADVKRRAQAEGLCQGASIEAAHRGGATRSSDEVCESRWSKGVASSGWKHRSTACGRNR